MTTLDHRRIRLVSDAVVSGYIREISTRSGSGPAPEPARAERLTQPPWRRRDRHARRTHHPARLAATASGPSRRSA